MKKRILTQGTKLKKTHGERHHPLASFPLDHVTFSRPLIQLPYKHRSDQASVSAGASKQRAKYTVFF